jgi:hypothetical protein
VSLRRVCNPFDPDESIPPASLLQQKTVQCLVLGKYATSNAYALEAFILHLQSSFFSNESHPVNLWFQMGTIIRLAFRMGHHRDPSTLTGISAFEGEMRRRVWMNIVQIEALMSFQIGFPSMISPEYCDTQTPRNLEYSDLQVNMPALPPARPLSESTPVRYTIVKNSVMGVFKKIVAHTQSLVPPTYDRTIALDSEMKQAYSKLPDILKYRDINRSVVDPSSLIWERCTIETLYLKGLIVLHRRYVNYEVQSPIYEPSRRICAQAALDMLGRLADVHKACQQGGRLYEERWMFFFLPIHDFLLGAMVLCLDVSVRMRSAATEGTEWRDKDFTDKECRALQMALHVWTINSANSDEARIAALAIDLMIKKVDGHDVHLMSAEKAPVPDIPPPYELEPELPYAHSMSLMIDGSENIDWVCYMRISNLTNITNRACLTSIFRI